MRRTPCINNLVKLLCITEWGKNVIFHFNIKTFIKYINCWRKSQLLVVNIMFKTKWKALFFNLYIANDWICFYILFLASLTTRRVSHIASDVTKSEAKLKEFEDELERLKNNELLLKDWFFLDSSSQPQQYKLKRIR